MLNNANDKVENESIFNITLEGNVLRLDLALWAAERTIKSIRFETLILKVNSPINWFGTLFFCYLNIWIQSGRAGLWRFGNEAGCSVSTRKLAFAWGLNGYVGPYWAGSGLMLGIGLPAGIVHFPEYLLLIKVGCDRYQFAIKAWNIPANPKNNVSYRCDSKHYSLGRCAPRP